MSKNKKTPWSKDVVSQAFELKRGCTYALQLQEHLSCDDLRRLERSLDLAKEKHGIEFILLWPAVKLVEVPSGWHFEPDREMLMGCYHPMPPPKRTIIEGIKIVKQKPCEHKWVFEEYGERCGSTLLVLHYKCRKCKEIYAIDHNTIAGLL